MDRRERAAWRAWKSIPTPENAQRWAYLRDQIVGGRRDETPLRNLDIPEDVKPVLIRALREFLQLDLNEALVCDLSLITECHYWLARVNPPQLRAVREWYEERGLVLQEGTEEQARSDKALASSEGRQHQKAQRLELRVKDLKRELAAAKRKAQETERDRAKIHELRGVEDSYRLLKRENERLTRLLQERD